MAAYATPETAPIQTRASPPFATRNDTAQMSSDACRYASPDSRPCRRVVQA